MSKLKPNLTEAELSCLRALQQAWNNYVTLPGRLSAENVEFEQAIHVAQRIIGTRVARRVDSDIWRQTDEEMEDADNVYLISYMRLRKTDSVAVWHDTLYASNFGGGVTFDPDIALRFTSRAEARSALESITSPGPGWSPAQIVPVKRKRSSE